MNNKTYSVTVGIDLGDNLHTICAIDHNGDILHKKTIKNNLAGINDYFRLYPDPGEVLVIIETGTHSPWISNHLKKTGFTVLVGNARKLRLIWEQPFKDDDRDAEMLARIGRFDPKLLEPITHRGRQAHQDLAVVKARDILVSSRTRIVTHIRGTVKSFGHKISSCSAESFARQARNQIPEGLEAAIGPLLDTLESINRNIAAYDREIKKISTEKYPETVRLQQVAGVGPLTALSYVLTLEDATRFKKSRDVGPYLGLTPRRDQSGETDRQLPISKAGNGFMRRLLVSAAHYILGPFGPQTDLRQYGERIAARGGKITKRKAVVAVARKLAVLLHRLWVSGKTYEPLRKNRQVAAAV